MSGAWSLIKAGTWTPVSPCIGWGFCVFVVFMWSLVSFPCFMKFGAIAVTCALSSKEKGLFVSIPYLMKPCFIQLAVNNKCLIFRWRPKKERIN